MALLITDGKQSVVNIPGEAGPVLVSRAMKARGIEIHAFGIGSADVFELLGYASHPSFVLKADDFSQLEGKVLDQVMNLCPRKFKLSLDCKLKGRTHDILYLQTSLGHSNTTYLPA